MEQDLSRSLHALTARLDRAADAILHSEAGMSYSRFLALFMVGSGGADTQRALAERLGVTEPSVSRMTRVLAESGLLEVTTDPAGGNRRQLRLTRAGQQLVERWGARLEQRLAVLLEDAGVPYETYAKDTKRLLERLDAQQAAPGGRTSAAGALSA